MSLTVSNPPKSERQELAQSRRQNVFAFIASHLDDKGEFSESDQFIANTVACSNRDSVKYAREHLQAAGDLLILEKDRWDKDTGKPLPNRVRPVPIHTFWLREWYRGGSKGAKPTVGTSASSAHGKQGSECPRTKSLESQDLTPKMDAPVPTVAGGGSAHKNSTLYRDQPYSLSVGLQSTESFTRCSAHGFFDLPVQRALNDLRDELAETQTQKRASPHNPYWSTKITEIEQDIADLEGETL
jgi:hypothetical protein